MQDVCRCLNLAVRFFLQPYFLILIPNQLLTWLAFVYLVLIITHIMSRGSSRPAQSAASLVSRLSLVNPTLPCFLARHQVAAIAVTLSSSFSRSVSSSRSVSLLSYRVNWQDWESGLSAPGLSLYSDCGKRKKTFTGRIRVHRNWSPLLFASADKPGLHLKIFLSFVFFLSVFLSIHAVHPVPRLVLCLHLSRQLTAQWQVLKMRSSGGREGEGLMRGTAAAGVCHCTSR